MPTGTDVPSKVSIALSVDLGHYSWRMLSNFAHMPVGTPYAGCTTWSVRDWDLCNTWKQRHCLACSECILLVLECSPLAVACARAQVTTCHGRVSTHPLPRHNARSRSNFPAWMGHRLPSSTTAPPPPVCPWPPGGSHHRLVSPRLSPLYFPFASS